MKARGVIPLVPFPGANHPWKSRCKVCRSTVYPRYATVVKRGLGGCDFCAKKASAATRNKQTETKALARLKELNLEPLEPYKNAHHKWKMRCLNCGTVSRKSWNGISNGHGCRSCSLQASGEKQRNKGSERAKALMRRAGLEPLVAYPGTHKPWQSKCQICGDLVNPRLSGIKAGQGGCPKCGTNRRAKSRMFGEEEARKMMEEAGARPDLNFPYPGVKRKWPSTCLTCGRHIAPTFGNIRAGHKPCRRCSMVVSGVSFDIWSPATLYLLQSKKFKAFKVGITSTRNSGMRLSAHRKQGWLVLNTWPTKTGQIAVFVEGEVLRWWRDDLGAPSAVRPEAMPQAGWTETVAASSVSYRQILVKVDKLFRQAQLLPPLPRDTREGRARCIAVTDGQQCDLEAVSRNFCNGHYRRWKKYGDPLGGKWPSKSISCGVEIDGKRCGLPIRSRDMCSVHYERWYTYGDPHFMKRPTPGTRSKKCVIEVDGVLCGRKVAAHEMCNLHYKHWQNHGDPLAGRFENPAQECGIFENGAACGRKAASRGMCTKHYNRWRMHGDALVKLRRSPGEAPKQCIAEYEGRMCAKPVHAKSLCRQHYRQRALVKT